MTTIPQLDIPHIMVDEGDDSDDARDGVATPQTPVRDGGHWESPAHLSAGARTSIHGGHSRSSSAATTDSNHRHSAWHHPLSMPRSASSTPSPPLSPSPSNLGFELRDVSGRPSESGEPHRRTSSVSPTQARDMLDDSVWMESIRRSTTNRRSDRSSHKYADLGR
jgi:voltage-dependent calcium channel